MKGPLDGIRIVDHTDLRGALCARILADLGADVIRIAPTPDPDDHAHAFRNANKARGELSDLEELAAAADLFIDNAGIDHDALVARHRQLVVVALTDMGRTGPRSHWRLEPLPAFASSGGHFLSGFREQAPCWMPGYLAHDCASVFGALGGLAAVLDRRSHGGGQVVEVSTQEAALSGLNPWSVLIPDYVEHYPYLPADGRRNADGNYAVYPARDGWVRTVIGTPQQWAGFVEVLGHPDAFSSPEWADGVFRGMNRDVVRSVASEILAQRDRRDLFEHGLRAGTTIGVIHTPLEYVAHPQVEHRGFFRTDVPGSEGLPFASAAWKLSATPASVRRGAPHASEPAARFAPRVPEQPSGGGGLLLDGVRVVEFGVAAVVPEMGWMLHDLGADVIKIESATHPDVLRQTGRGNLDMGFAFNAECRGRRSVALDLSTDRGRQLAFELCASADIVAENQRGGSLAKLGLGYDDLAAVRPDIIYVSSQGYGRGGPMGEMPAYGPLNSGFAGTHWLWNHADSPFPCGTSLNHPDHIAGKLLAVAALAALAHRWRTGEGQLVDMAQTEAAAFLMGEVYLAAAATGADPQPQGNRSTDVAPHDVYPAGGDDEWVAIACHDDESWNRLCGVIGLENRWPTSDARLADVAAIDTAVAAWAALGSADERADTLQDAGVSAMAVMGPEDHRRDDHLAARAALDVVEHPAAGTETHVANPIRFGRTATRVAGPSPLLGAHTAEVLAEVLHIGPDATSELIEAGACR